MHSTHPRRSGPSARRNWGAAACLVLLVALSACTDDAAPGGTSGSGSDNGSANPDADTAVLNEIAEPITVVGEDDSSDGDLSVQVSQALFASAPAVVVVPSGDSESMTQASSAAVELGVPLLVLPNSQADSNSDSAASTESSDGSSQSAAPDDSAGPTDSSAQVDEIGRLGASMVLAVGPDAEQALGDVSDADVVTEADDIEDVAPAAGASDLVVLLPGDDSVSAYAAEASAQAAGAIVIPVDDSALVNDSDAITALAQAQPDQVVAVGAGFGSADALTRTVDVAKTGAQLPGGGLALFPDRRLVALYGTPGTAGLGVLGEQDADASIVRAKELAAEFEPYSDVPTVPAFEIIATIAQGSAGADGDYSGEVSVESLRPWVEKAGEEGVYVVLDLQPGRANFLDQAKIYEDLLRMPHVGLALDPEWRLTSTQKPLGQIGRVEAAEVNSVIDWLADLTAEEDLPQKLLVLHQFRLTMLQDQDQIEMGRDEVQVLIHMDGQGATGDKDATWAAVIGAAQPGTPFGWKNFYDEDIPMLTPEQTMTREPTPFMISYQ
ncbi:MAG: hypothetical protein WA880_01315 [Ornithinimicrobium sp.]